MKNKQSEDKFVSKCCKAPMTVEGNEDGEGTVYYVCSNCKKPCNFELIEEPKTNSWWEQGLEEFVMRPEFNGQFLKRAIYTEEIKAFIAHVEEEIIKKFEIFNEELGYLEDEHNTHWQEGFDYHFKQLNRFITSLQKPLQGKGEGAEGKEKI